MKETILLKEITIKDSTENDVEVQVLIFKDLKSGGLFGIDSSFVDQNFDEDEEIRVIEPINGTKVLLDI